MVTIPILKQAVKDRLTKDESWKKLRGGTATVATF